MSLTDNSSPPLSATQTFTITVTAPPATALPASGFGVGREAVVTALYLEDLNRLPEPKGLKYWSKSLARGAKPRTVAVAWQSYEHRALQCIHLAPKLSFSTSYSDALK